VLKEAKRIGAKKVLEVQLILGRWTFFGTDQIRFSYDILVKDTSMEGSKLIIEENEGKIKCHVCGFLGKKQLKDDPEYHLTVPSLQCPKCGKEAEIVEGRECIIKSIKMEKEEE
jgi:hydrogenase nickel incorporation protein HypA/HybF